MLDREVSVIVKERNAKQSEKNTSRFRLPKIRLNFKNFFYQGKVNEDWKQPVLFIPTTSPCYWKKTKDEKEKKEERFKNEVALISIATVLKVENAMKVNNLIRDSWIRTQVFSIARNFFGENKNVNYCNNVNINTKVKGSKINATSKKTKQTKTLSSPKVSSHKKEAAVQSPLLSFFSIVLMINQEIYGQQ